MRVVEEPATSIHGGDLFEIESLGDEAVFAFRGDGSPREDVVHEDELLVSSEHHIKLDCMKAKLKACLHGHEGVLRSMEAAPTMSDESVRVVEAPLGEIEVRHAIRNQDKG